METLSVKYICKLTALVSLLAIGFIYKVPSGGKKAVIANRQQEYSEQLKYTQVNVSKLHKLSNLYQFIVPAEESRKLVTL